MLVARRRRSAALTPNISSGYSMFSYAEKTGIRLKFWKMKPTRCARKSEIALSVSVATSCPATTTRPAVGVSRQPIRLSSVVFPLPEGPTITEKRRRGILNVTPLTAGTSTSPTLYVLKTSVRLTTELFDGVAMAFSLSARNQGSQRHERTHGNVLVVDQVLFRQWHRVDDGVGFVDGLRVDQENHASTVAPGVPLA